MLGWPRRSADAQLRRARTLTAAGQLTQAAAIWTALAQAGNPRGQTNLGAAYATGAGVPPDPVAARHWLLRGAEAGDALGQRNLATLLLPDAPDEAAIWYRRAAEQGDAISQDQLSLMLLDSAPEDARRWAEAAALQGLVAAAARLALLSHDAKGGPRDPAKAAHWWRFAAERGDADSAAMLGAVLHMGQGVPPDSVAAMGWLLVGSARGSVRVRPFFAVVEAALSPAELDAARALAARYAPP